MVEGVVKRKQLQFPPDSWVFADWQQSVWDETEDLNQPQWIVLNCGRGAGKDILSIRCALRDAFKLYKQKKKDIAEGKLRAIQTPIVSIFLVSSSDDKLNQTILEMENCLESLAAEWEIKPDRLYKRIKRDKMFWILGRGEIEVYHKISSTAGSLRGSGIDICLWTEFAFEQREQAFRDEFQGTLLRPGRLGRVYLYSTPNGPFGAFFQQCQIAQEDQTGNYLYKHATSYDALDLTDAQVQRLEAKKKQDPDTFDQENLAKFVILTGGGRTVYKKDNLEKCYILKKSESESKGRDIVIGVDIAYETSGDSTVFAILDKHKSELIRVERFQKTTAKDIIAHLERLDKEFGSPRFKMDSTFRLQLSDFLPKGIDIEELVVRQNSKIRYITQLNMLIQKNDIRIPHPESYEFKNLTDKENLGILIKEILEFEVRHKQDYKGTVVYGHPVGGHDDCVFALCYAVDDLVKPQLDTKQTKKRVSGLF